MKRKTANWSIKEGRLTSMLVNCFERPENASLAILSRLAPMGAEMSLCINPFIISPKLKL